MENEVRAMTFKELKAIVEKMSAEKIADDTKIFLDTGWDSIQEILPNSISTKEAKHFQVQDELTKEYYGGYALLAKAEKMQAEGEPETVIVIENLY